MFTALFWRDAVERASKTAAQAAVAALGVGAVGILDVDWAGVAAAAALGFVLSVLTSVASEPFGDAGTPSLLTTDTPPSSGDDGGDMIPVGD